MGVINRTPNSFSDQGLSLETNFFTKQLQSFLDDPTVVIDIGFESTAPMNQAVSLKVEKDRFLDFLKASKDFNFSDRFVSFDTYRPLNFLFMSESFKRLHPKTHFIFNDVSGVLDAELKEALLNFKGEKFYYIYTCSHIPSREHVLDHMSFVKKEEILKTTIEAFKNAHQWFEEIGMKDSLILDPGFGFSKSYEDNWILINEMETLEKELGLLDIKNPLLIGLSKKSFLKKKLVSEGELVTEKTLEDLHSKIIRAMLLKGQHRKLFRVHDPKILP